MEEKRISGVVLRARIQCNRLDQPMLSQSTSFTTLSVQPELAKCLTAPFHVWMAPAASGLSVDT